MELLGLDLCVLTWGHVVGCCECGHSPSVSAACREFLDYLEELFLSKECLCAIELVSCSLSLFDNIIIVHTAFLTCSQRAPTGPDSAVVEPSSRYRLQSYYYPFNIIFYL